MSDTIESLLQENLQQIQTMHTASEQMLRNANVIFEYGHKYQARFDNSYHKALAKLEIIQQRVNQITENLTTDEFVDKVWYDVVTQNAEMLGQTMLAAEQKALQALQKVSAHLEAQHARVSSYLTGSGEAFDAVNHRTDEVDNEFKAAANDLTATYTSTTDEVKDMCGRFHDQHRDIQTTLEELQAKSNEHGTEVSNTTDESLDELESKVKELIEASGAKSDDALDIVGESFSDDISQTNASGAGSLGDSVQGIIATFDGSTSSALGSIESLTGNLDEIVSLAKKIEPVLNLVKALV